MPHPKMIEFDEQLKKLFDEVDEYIEKIYGSRYPLHPARPVFGETADPESNGLFNIGADFTPGYCSERGRGYLITIKMSTLEKVDSGVRGEIYEAAADKARQLLPVHFPERQLVICRDGNFFKLQGDFSLGTV